LAAENWKERQPKEELALGVTSEIYLLELTNTFNKGNKQSEINSKHYTHKSFKRIDMSNVILLVVKMRK
jgi:hypothetical protein